MKLRRLLVGAMLTLPFWLALALDAVLQAGDETVSVLHIQVRIDPGTLALVGGASMTLILLGCWVVRQKIRQRAEISQAHIQREAAQLRRRFLAQLDHELKNPLTALRAAIAYLADGLEVENYDKAIGDMSTQVERLGRLITDLRKLAELEELEIERQSVDMGELLEEVMEAAQGHPGYEERQVRLLLLQDPWRLPLLKGDRGLLWLACYNLVDNALKFTPANAYIEVRAFIAQPWLTVEVVDSGPGISEADLPHIFEQLYRGINARGLPGSGLGLALVRAIVNRHQGTIQVRSQPGQGSVFTMRLPVTTQEMDTKR
ncbi:MAG: HAMP domain-containing histidine kinase [Anaerolineales bacterium]|nr:HAMP domain-containing histidine kinase [Anaerolineales bacterium]